MSTREHYPVHDLARMFPAQASGEFAEMKASIASVGQLQPIVVWHGQIIDGSQRYQACLELGQQPIYRFLDDDVDPIAYVIGANINRRHLDASQRAIIGYRLSEWSKVVGHRNSDYPRTGRKQDEPLHSRVGGNARIKQGEAAKLLNVGNNSIRRAGKVLRPDGPAVPVLREAVENGSIKVTDAAAVVNKPAEIQVRATQRVMEAQHGNKHLTVREAAKEVEREIVKEQWTERQKERRSAPQSNEATFFLAHCADLRDHVAPDSVDIILTDPPYKPDSLSCYKDLAEFAAHALKPGGVLLALAGTSHLPQVMEYLCNTEGLTYHWTINYLMPGGNLRFHTRAVRMGWKPVVWLVKGQSDGTDRFDVVEAPALAQQDTRFHEWGQNEGGFQKLLDLFAFPGQMVCDPFLGGGTTAVVARRNGCRFIGADVDPHCLDTTMARLSTIESYQ